MIAQLLVTKKNNKDVSWLAGGVLAVFMLVGSANVSADDPMEDWNRDVLSFNDGLDDYFLKPVSQGYQWIMPEFADTGISNFFSNLSDIGVFVNDIFQLKLEQGGADFGRFLVNSTVGVGGFVDVATMIDLPKHKEDFGQTLAFWGVPSGPYMVVPLFGSSTPRGVVGAIGDIALHPLSYIGVPGASFGAGALNAVHLKSSGRGPFTKIDFMVILVSRQIASTPAAMPRMRASRYFGSISDAIQNRSQSMRCTR